MLNSTSTMLSAQDVVHIPRVPCTNGRIFCPDFTVKCTMVCKRREKMGRLRVERAKDEEEGRGLCCSEVQPSDLLLSCGPVCSATEPVKPSAPQGSNSAQRVLLTEAPLR